MENNMNFEQVLHKINKFVTLDPNDRQPYTQVFLNVAHFIITEMCKCCEIFNSLYNGPCLQGSYLDNLKINKPDEFDFVLKLKLRDSHLVDVEEVRNGPGFVSLNLSKMFKKIKTESHSKKLYEILLKWVNSDGYLVQNKLNAWIESIIDRILKKNTCIKIEEKYYIIEKYKKSGPAFTLLINQDGRSISVDFVPALVFDKSKSCARRKFDPYEKKTDWLAIPKPNKQCNSENIGFQISYTDAECKYIHNQYSLKTALRLLKQLREKKNIQNLKSYFIKTVFLWKSDEMQTKDPNYWSRNSLSYIFLDMFQTLLKYIERRNIPFFWDDRQNMLNQFNENQISTMYDQLKAIYYYVLKYKDTSPEKIFEVFLTQDEQNGLIEGKDLSTVVFEQKQKDSGWCSLL